MSTAGVRGLKARSSVYRRPAEAGATIVITERGRPIGRIVLPAGPSEERMWEPIGTGMAAWSGRKVAPAGSGGPHPCWSLDGRPVAGGSGMILKAGVPVKRCTYVLADRSV